MKNQNELWLPLKEACRRGVFKVGYITMFHYYKKGLIDCEKMTGGHSPLWVDWYSVPTFLRRKVDKKVLEELQNYRITKKRKSK